MTTVETCRSGALAKASGVSVDTLRFYEREGLLPEPVRSTGGARRYGPDALNRVRFIKQAQGAGLTLKDIRILLDARRGASSSACRRTRAILADRLAELHRRIQDMQEVEGVLNGHLEACDRALEERARECPTLDAIEHGTVPARATS
jgi:DNA-binding transcriptional MerR regulator